ncbi:MAG TPA: sensor histidine kinase [Thermomicrobiaceae bacterium]|nr:sensor histidine kinase [Thermomicrobiaceae bacterium]
MNLSETLAEARRSIDESIAASESQLGRTGEELRLIAEGLQEEHARLEDEAQERELDRLLETPSQSLSTGQETPDSERHRESVALEYSLVSSLYRQVNDFTHLLASSRQRFRLEDELLGPDDAQRLSVRQAMIRAQESERRRLARDVHDGPAQVLANAILSLELIERSLPDRLLDPDAKTLAEIERTKNALREGLTEIRRFIFDLRPTMLHQRGLIATVEHYVETYRHLFPAKVELVLPSRMPRLSEDQELTAFSVIQESLQNVHRHSRARQVEVALSTTPDGLFVRVRDDGQGFRPAATLPTPTGGFGLAGMRERAEVVGGRLTIRSTPGNGTEITLVIPLTPGNQTISVESDPRERRSFDGSRGDETR